MAEEYGLRLPAMRGVQGVRTMFVSLVSLKTLANRFPINPNEPLESRAQRLFNEEHAEDITNYIVGNDDYILGALTLTVSQDPVWHPSKDDPRIGTLVIPPDVETGDSDGLHRHVGIREAIKRAVDRGKDDVALVIYVEGKLPRRRQMFSDQNFNQRPVPKSVNVAFESRNPFARAANAIIATHPLLKGRVEAERARVRKNSGKLVTAGAVYDALKRLMLGPSAKKTIAYKEKEILEQGVEFFDLLLDARSEFAAIVNDADVDIEDLRKHTILLSSTTLRMLAGATWIAKGRGYEMAKLKKPLRDIDFRPSASIWLRTGFVAKGQKTPNARNQEVLAASTAVADLIAPPRSAAAS